MVSGPYLDLSFPSLPPSSSTPRCYNQQHSNFLYSTCIHYRAQYDALCYLHCAFLFVHFPANCPTNIILHTNNTNGTDPVRRTPASAHSPPAPRIRHRPGGRPSRIWLDGAFRGNRHSEIGFPLLFATSSRRVFAF